MKRFILWSSLLVLVVAIVGIAFASVHSFTHHRWHHHYGPLGYAARELNLSADQRSKIKTIWQQEKPAIAPLVREFSAENKEMDAAITQGNLDQGKVQEIAERQGATVAKLLIKKEELKTEIYTTVLTTEQRAKADRLQEQWNSRLDRVANQLEQTSRSPSK